jgi:hypothetical protein
MVISEGQLFAWVTADGRAPQIVAGTLVYLMLMLAFCALSCIAPTRRALGIEPSEALKAEGSYPGGSSRLPPAATASRPTMPTPAARRSTVAGVSPQRL